MCGHFPPASSRSSPTFLPTHPLGAPASLPACLLYAQTPAGPPAACQSAAPGLNSAKTAPQVSATGPICCQPNRPGARRGLTVTPPLPRRRTSAKFAEVRRRGNGGVTVGLAGSARAVRCASVVGKRGCGFEATARGKRSSGVLECWVFQHTSTPILQHSGSPTLHGIRMSEAVPRAVGPGGRPSHQPLDPETAPSASLSSLSPGRFPPPASRPYPRRGDAYS